MASLADNYLNAEQPIIDQLRAAVPMLAFVDGSRSVQSIVERTVPLPAALVIYNGDIVNEQESAEMGAVNVIQQKWVVELIVRNGIGFDSGTGERTDAGQLISQVLHALSGFPPTHEHRGFYRVQGAPPLYDQGEAYFQLAFITEILTQ